MASKSKSAPPTGAPRSAAAWIHRAAPELSGAAVPERAEFMAGGYASSSLKFLGVPVPALRSLARTIHADLKAGPPSEVLQFALLAMDSPYHEVRQLGYEVLTRSKPALASIKTKELRKLITGLDNWASVDACAVLVTGPMWLAGNLPDKTVLTWAVAKDRWHRRLALASTVCLNTAARGGQGDSPRTLAVLAHFTAETDPMLAKAISWAIRSLVPHDPAGVQAFLVKHEKSLPAIVRREVSTKLTTGKKTAKKR